MSIISILPTLVSTIAICYAIIIRVKLWDAKQCLAGHMQSNDNALREVKRLNESIKGLYRRHELDLRMEEAYYNESTASLTEALKASRKLCKEQQEAIDDYALSGITAIKFTAHVPNTGWARTEFKLGIGPCGKEVTALHWLEKDDRYELTQACTDGERKEFTYYKKDVAGRIEIAYKMAPNTTHYRETHSLS